MTDVATHEVDFEAIKQVQKQIWSVGDFARVATMTTIVGEELCEAVDVAPGERVLDVACGSGNGALAAARRTSSASLRISRSARSGTGSGTPRCTSPDCCGARSTG